MTAVNRGGIRRALPRRERLYLLFRLGEDRYALDARQVVEVLPLCRLKALPGTPPWVAGLLMRHGRLVPVIDLGRRLLGEPTQALTSTRLVLVELARPQAQPYWLGLILAQATDTLRAMPEAFAALGVDAAQAPGLGPVLTTARGLVQRIEVQALVPPDVLQLLLSHAEAGDAHD